MKDTLQKPVVFILPRGEAIRNFAHTGTLTSVNQRCGCVAISVKPNERIWDELAGLCRRLEPLQEFRERYPARILRDLLDLAHGRWLWSEAAKERWRLRDLEAVTPGQKAARVLKKTAVLPFANRPGLSLLSAMERAASRVLRTTEHYVNLFRELQPALVFNGSHVHSANSIQPTQAAQWLGIPTATFIFSWDNLTSQGRVLPAYDHYLVWNEQLKQQLLQIYSFVRPEQVHVTGTPQFDAHFRPDSFWSREEFCRRIGADADRPLVVYGTGMPNHMPGEEEIIESIADTLKLETAGGVPQLLVRIYAKDKTKRFDELKRRRRDILFPEVPWEANWLTPLPEDLPLLTNTLRHAALGINVASTLSLEFCMFDKPVINIAFNPPSVPESVLSYRRYYEFDHYRPVVESGAVRLARNPAEVRELALRAFQHPEADSAHRRRLLQRMFGNTLDGECSRRVAETLARLAAH